MPARHSKKSRTDLEKHADGGSVLNLFKCPYGGEHETLLRDGKKARRLLEHLEWYNHHWNLDPSHIPADDEMEWYHFNEPLSST